LSGNYNFFNFLTALLACSCLCDKDLPRFLKLFASAAIQRVSINPSPTQPAPVFSGFTRLFQLLPLLLPPLLFFYMFRIVPSPPGPVRVTSAQMSPPAPLQHMFSLLSLWTVQFRNFSVDMFHTEAAAVVTFYVAVSLFSAAAATAREIVNPVPSSSSSSSSSSSVYSRIMRNLVVFSSFVSLIIGSILLIIIITPFSWTVALPLFPKQAFELHAITAQARLSSSYGGPKSILIWHFKLTLFRSVPFNDWRRQRPRIEVEWHGCTRAARSAPRTYPGGIACRK